MNASRSRTRSARLEIAVVAIEHRASSGDYRFSAESTEFPGCLSFGATKAEALRRCQAVVLRLLAEGMRRRDVDPLLEVSFLLMEGTEPARDGARA